VTKVEAGRPPEADLNFDNVSVHEPDLTFGSLFDELADAIEI
jgi:hypothetical protein